MNLKQKAAERSAYRIKTGLPWVLLLVVSASLGYVMNTAAVRALSTNRPDDAVSTGAQDVSNLCALDEDGALYAGVDWWLPARRSAFCRAESYPGVAARDIASQLTRVGPLQATITYVAPTQIRIDLYCPNSTQQRAANADFVSAADARTLYAQVCASAGSPE